MTETMSTPRTSQSSSPVLFRKREYELRASGPRKTRRLPRTCPIRNTIPISPVTAITTFFPIADRYRRTARFIPRPALQPYGGHRLPDRVGTLVERLAFALCQLDLQNPFESGASQLARHAEEQSSHAVFTFEPRRAGEDSLLIVDDRFAHLDGRRRGRVI